MKTDNKKRKEKMTSSTYSNVANDNSLTIRDIRRAIKIIESIPPQPIGKKLIVLCRTHYKRIMKEFKVESTASPYSSIIGSLEVQFYIRPYLKKPRIIDVENFNFKPNL